MIKSTLLLTLALAGAFEPIPPGTPKAAVHFIDVGQGVSTLVVSPTGKTLLIDGGEDGMGSGRIVPLLHRLGITRLDWMVATHWHPDHVGGLDEVVQAGFAPALAYDRGDVNRPTGYGQVTDYLQAVGGARATATPGLSLDLGGGMRATCLVVNGAVHQGPTVSFANRNQEENGRSIGLLIRYAGFDLWVGGDLTGGGNGTADVEGPTGAVCGNVDMYLANHHGSNTSSSASFLAALDPEVSILSSGPANPYGHPTQTVVDRLSTPTSVRLLLGTTAGAGAEGFIVAGSVGVETDGYIYTIDAGSRQWVLAVDGRPGTPPVPGELRISELHRQPLGTSGPGEYLEWCHLGPSPLDLKGTVLSASGATQGVVVGMRLLHYPGQYLVAADGGNPATNGGVEAHLVWPRGSLALPDSSGWVALSPGEQLVYGSGFPGGAGRAAERIDLHQPPAAANFTGATAGYGTTNLGTPGRRNQPDATLYSPDLAVISPQVPGRRIRFTLYHPSGAGAYYLIGLSGGSSPGFRFDGRFVPLNLDPLFSLGLLLPGLSGWLPSKGLVGPCFTIPPDPTLIGMPGFAAGLILTPWASRPLQGVTPARSFILP